MHRYDDRASLWLPPNSRTICPDHFRLEEARRLGEAQKRIAQREVGKDAGVEDDGRRTRYR